MSITQVELNYASLDEERWRLVDLNDVIDQEPSGPELDRLYSFLEDLCDEAWERGQVTTDETLVVYGLIDRELRTFAVADPLTGSWCGAIAEFLGEAWFVTDRDALPGWLG